MPQIFPKWSNTAAKLLPIIIVIKLVAIVFVFWYWFSPLNLEVGYRPKQPIPFSHKLHVSDLQIDCLYCHSNAEKSAFGSVPSTQTCMNCHEHQANKDSLNFSLALQSWRNNTPIPWVRVHKVGDYAYFDHSAHIKVGVGCISCHGNIDQMVVVKQEKPLSMGWCLECHRDPAPHLRPKDQITNMEFHQSEAYKQMAKEKAKNLHPPIENCSGCHR